MALTAQQFVQDLNKLSAKGLSMGDIFALAKANKEMSLDEVLKLLKTQDSAAKVGAVSIMDYQARDKKTSPERRKELFDLYINNHDLIDNWGLVDRSAIYVVGGYLSDKPGERDILYKLAKSSDPNRRRTAAVATFYFIMKQDDLDDAYKIAEVLMQEPHELTQKAAGWVLRTAGDHDQKRLHAFLDKYAEVMPRPMLRNAIEKLPKEERTDYLNRKKAAQGK